MSEHRAWEIAAQLCGLCLIRVPHHTVGVGAISDGDRRIVSDLHEVSCDGGVTLEECLAGDFWDLYREARRGA